MSNTLWPYILMIDTPTWAERKNLKFSSLLVLKIGSLIGLVIVLLKLVATLSQPQTSSLSSIIQASLLTLLLAVHFSCQNFSWIRHGGIAVVASLSFFIILGLLTSSNPHYSGSYHFVSGIMLFAGFLLGLRYVLALYFLFTFLYACFAHNLWTPNAPTNLYVDRMLELLIVTLFVGLYHRLKERQYKIISEQERASIHKEKLLSINRMAGGIAHEINNPLAIVMGYIEILSDQDKDRPLDRRVLSRVTHACERISSIVSSILKLTRDNDGGSLELVVLNESCQFHCNELSHFKPFTQVRCQVQVEAVIFSIPGGSWDLILKPILQNAFEATVSQPSPKVEVFSDVRDNCLELTVADNGPAFDETQISSFFEPFYTSKQEVHGRGMGLTIAYVLATRLGWLLNVNREGKWTRVCLKIPLSSLQNLTLPSEHTQSKDVAEGIKLAL